MKVLSIINQKGGVGKTTTTFHIGTILSENLRVLMIDLDPQGGLTFTSTGKDPDEFEITMADVFLGEKNITEVVLHLRKNLDLAPSNIFLSEVEVKLITAIQRELKLKNALSIIKSNYDIVIIDTPPSLGLLTINALFASQAILIPVEAKVLGIRGLVILQNLLLDIKKNVPEFNIDIFGILPTFYDIRTTLSKEVVQELKDIFGKNTRIFPPIKSTVKLAEVPAIHIPIQEREKLKKSEVARVYTEVAKEVEKWVKNS